MASSRWLKPLRTLLLIPCLAACSAPYPEMARGMTGNDRDTQGCIPSAGYLWCERTKQCERPWELANARGFALAGNAFADFCKTPE